MAHIHVIKRVAGAVAVACAIGFATDHLVAQASDGAVLVIIDKESIEYGLEPYQVPPEALNEVIASVGVRDPLPFFAANAGRQFYLRTGVNGNDSWFGFTAVPPRWATDGASNDGLQNYALAGPGLGSPDASGNRESLLDQVTDVTPVRSAGANLLVGRTVCAVIYDADLTAAQDAVSGVSLKGANLGFVAFRVNTVIGSSSDWPTVVVEILDVRQACSETLLLLPQPSA